MKRSSFLRTQRPVSKHNSRTSEWRTNHSPESLSNAPTIRAQQAPKRSPSCSQCQPPRTARVWNRSISATRMSGGLTLGRSRGKTSAARLQPKSRRGDANLREPLEAIGRRTLEGLGGKSHCRGPPVRECMSFAGEVSVEVAGQILQQCFNLVLREARARHLCRALARVRAYVRSERWLSSGR